jgi:glyoxylase-like metal-dependent hydrolase (beta-lactamase superfamily II)
MTEIMTGIHQFQIPIPNNNPLGHTNSYLVHGEDKHLLIDTGWNTEEAFQSLKDQLAEAGTDFRDISQMIITHVHPDHYGLANRVRELSQAKISLHEQERELINLRYQNMDEFLRQTEEWLHINGVPDNALPPFPRRITTPAQPDTILQGGEKISIGIFNLEVLWTPGHAPGHICLYEPSQKILFAGDHVLPGITPNIGLQTASGLNPLGDFLNSLNELKQMDVNLILPGHEYHFTGLSARIEDVIQHHKNRISEIMQTLKNQPKTAYQVATEIIWMLDEGGARFQDLVPWDKRLAVFEAIAHLEAMRVDGMVEKFPRDTLFYYQQTGIANNKMN